mgnify:CR=1 FL=1
MDKLVPDAENLSGFIEQFSVFAKSPNGVEKLRNLILDLAIRGKLVFQNSNDNSIGVLWKEITAEKERLVKEKKIRKPKKLPDVSNEEKPFQIPNNWKWFRLEDLYYSISPSGKKLKNSEISVEGEYPVVDQGKKYIAGYTNNADLLIKIPKPVIVFGDHTTEKKYIDFDFVAGADGTKILCPYIMDEKYFYTYLLSYKLENRGYARHFKVLNANLMALPPLEEQKRIVAKVDELMALCDKLEAQQQQQAKNVLRANTAAINALLNPSDPKASFEQNWQRIAQHFNTLYGCTLPMPKGEGRKKKHLVGLENVKALRSVITSMALMGKLLKNQDNSNAHELLLDIFSDQQEFLSKRELNKLLKISSEIHQEFIVPDDWIWAKFGQCVMAVQTGPFGSALHKNEYIQDGIPVINPTNIKNGNIVPDNRVTVDLSTFERLASYEVRENDIVLGRRGKMGRSAIVKEHQSGWLCGTGSLVIRTSPRVFNEFLTLLLGSKYIVDQLTKGAVGITMLNIGQSALLNLNIALPPLEEQKRIVTKVDQLMALCDQLEQQLTQSYSDAEKLMQVTVKALVA